MKKKHKSELDSIAIEFSDPDIDLDDDDEGIRDKAFEILREIVDSAECDKATGEVILWGRWDHAKNLCEERFQSVDELQIFLESFGWVPTSKESATFSPYANNSLVDEYDVGNLIKRLIRDHGLSEILAGAQDFVSKRKIFDFREVSQSRLVCDTEVPLITVNSGLIQHLAKNPTLLYDLQPRTFEQLVAELFESIGFETVLTPRTRDGGFDVRAVRNSSFGTLLYLIECKKYAPDRPVGVELVRSLYGTVQAERATHGILATTSYFSKPATQYADKLKYQLSLHDYSNLTRWLEEYKAEAQRL